MIDCIDSPLSLLVLAPAVYSFFLFGVGLLLPNCPCCADDVECAGPFVRCRREECTSCDPQYGFSRAIRTTLSTYAAWESTWNAPTTVSTLQVCTTPQVTVSTRGDYFKSLSNGESLTITATQTKQKNNATAQMRLNAQDPLIPAVFTVNVTGVDWPLELAGGFRLVSFNAPLSGFSVLGSFGDTSLSINAATSVTIKNAYLPLVTADLDGNLLTNDSLMALVSATLTKNGGVFDLQFSVANPAALFPYTPNGSSVFIGYTVELQRGITKTYRDFIFIWASITGQNPADIPEEGLTPPNVPQLTYDDVNTTPPPAPSQPAANVINTHSRSSLVLTTPAYTLDVSGDDLRFSFNHVVAAEQYAPFVTRSLSCAERRYVFAPFGEVENDNFDEVDEFLAGLRCFKYTGDGVRRVQLSTISGDRFIPGNGEEWEVCLEPPNVFCGRGVCHFQELVAPETATFVNSPAAGECTGVALSAVGQLWNCGYIALTSVCGAGQTYGPTNPNLRGFWYQDIVNNARTGGAIPLTSFFKGDLLYSIENGPTFESVTVGETVVTLGGAPLEGNAWATRYACEATGMPGVGDRELASPSGLCPPLSFTVSVSEMGLSLTKISGGDRVSSFPTPEGGSDTAKAFCNSCELGDYVGNPQGDYVVELSYLDCGGVGYLYQAPPNKDGSLVYGVNSISGGVARTKCGEFEGTTTIQATVQTKIFCPETNNLEIPDETFTGLVKHKGWFPSGATLKSPEASPATNVFRPFSSYTDTGPYICDLAVSVDLTDDFETENTGKFEPLCVPISVTPGVVKFYGNPPDGFKTSREPGLGEYTGEIGFAIEDFPNITFGNSGSNDEPLPKKRRWLSGCNVASVGYQSKPCGIINANLRLRGVFLELDQPLSNGTLSGNLPSRQIIGNLEPLYYQNTKCESITITAPDWVKIEENPSPLGANDYCVTVSANSTGSPRSGKITLEPVWLVNGLPSAANTSTAALGPYSYDITQDA